MTLKLVMHLPVYLLHDLDTQANKFGDSSGNGAWNILGGMVVFVDVSVARYDGLHVFDVALERFRVVHHECCDARVVRK
jgi:hypothetical protein